MKRAQEADLLPPSPPTLSPSTGKQISGVARISSQFSYAQDKEPPLPSIFANPPRLLAEALLAIRSYPNEQYPSSERVGISSPCKSLSETSLLSEVSVPLRSVKSQPEAELVRSPGSTTNLEQTLALDSDIVLAPGQMETLNKLGSVTGDGMTPALIEGRTMELKEDLGPEMLVEILERLATTRKGRLLFQGEWIDEKISKQHMKKSRRESALLSSRRRSTPLRLSQFNKEEVLLLKELKEHLKNGNSGICSLAIKCSFGSFTEAVLAGTEDGEVEIKMY